MVPYNVFLCKGPGYWIVEADLHHDLLLLLVTTIFYVNIPNWWRSWEANFKVLLFSLIRRCTWNRWMWCTSTSFLLPLLCGQVPHSPRPCYGSDKYNFSWKFKKLKGLPYILIIRVFRPMVLSGQWNMAGIKSLINLSMKHTKKCKKKRKFFESVIFRSCAFICVLGYLKQFGPMCFSRVYSPMSILVAALSELLQLRSPLNVKQLVNVPNTYQNMFSICQGSFSKCVSEWL